MKLLFNPRDGAPIRDVWYKFSKYFAEPFVPGKVVQVDNGLADFVLETFGFVQEVTASEAKRIMALGAEVFKCEKCGKEVSTKLALAGHSRTHESEEGLEGIQTIKIVTVETVGEEKKHDPFAAGEAEDKAAGLEGEGLVNEAPKRAVIMR